MKKKIIFIVGFLVLVFLGWMVYTSVNKLNKKDAIETSQKDLPKLLTKLGRSDINIAQSSILIFFNSECERCQWEIELLSKNLDKLKKHQLLLTSFEPESESRDFLSKYDLSGFYLKSPPEKVMSAFTGGVPQTLQRRGKSGVCFKCLKARMKSAKLNKNFILQHGQSDCGAACLASVIQFHGGTPSLDEIRRITGTTKTGTKLLGLFQGAKQLGFKAAGLEAEGIDNLKELDEPAILHVVLENQLQHYVVFYGFEGEQLGDPER